MNNELPRTSRICLKIAFWCWLIPLAIAFVCLFGWLATQSVLSFPFLALLDIWLGIILLCIGFISLAIGWFAARRHNRKFSVWKPALLLLSNLPVAAVFFWLGLYLMEQTDVTVINQCPHPLTNISFTDFAGTSYPFPDVATGQEIKQTFRFKDQGEMTYKLYNGVRTIEDYLIYNSPPAPNSPITLKADSACNVSITRKRNAIDEFMSEKLAPTGAN